jgi:hypothetical protein
MILPPSVIRLRTYGNDRRKMNLWLPVCMLWPPVVLIALLLTPIAVPVLWFAAGRGRRRWAVMAGPVLFYLLCALRGFKFEAGNAEDGVSMTIY